MFFYQPFLPVRLTTGYIELVIYRHMKKCKSALSYSSERCLMQDCSDFFEGALQLQITVSLSLYSNSMYYAYFPTVKNQYKYTVCLSSEQRFNKNILGKFTFLMKQPFKFITNTDYWIITILFSYHNGCNYINPEI